ADLPFQRRPVEDHGSPRVLRQFLAFAAVVIGEEGEPALINAFEKNHPRRRSAALIGSGQDHRIWLWDNLQGLLKPFLELLDWIGVQVAFIQSGQSVFFAKIRNRHPGNLKMRLTKDQRLLFRGTEPIRRRKAVICYPTLP